MAAERKVPIFQMNLLSTALQGIPTCTCTRIAL